MTLTSHNALLDCSMTFLLIYIPLLRHCVHILVRVIETNTTNISRIRRILNSEDTESKEKLSNGNDVPTDGELEDNQLVWQVKHLQRQVFLYF